MTSLPIKTHEGSGGVTKWGYHELEPFLKCAKRYQLERVRHIGRPVTAVPIYFTAGALLHAGRAKWLALGSCAEAGPEAVAHLEVAMEKLRNEGSLPVSEAALEEARRYLSEYIDHYSTRPAPKTIATELELGAEFHGQPFTCRLDDLSYYDEAGGGLCLGECKTTSGSIKACLNKYQLHPQPILQRKLYAMDSRGEAVSGAVLGTILDVVKKGYSGRKSEFARVLLRFDQQVIDGCVKWLASNRTYARALHWDGYYAIPGNPRTLEPAGRNYAACNEMDDHGTLACPYRDLCLHGRDASLEYVVEGTFLTEYKMKEGQTCQPWD